MNEAGLHAWMRELLAEDPAEVVAVKCGVVLATARRWKARRGFRLPAVGTLERVFVAYSVGLGEQRAALAALAALRPPVSPD